MAFERRAIAQEFNTPLFVRNVELYSPFAFREEPWQQRQNSSVLGFRRMLNKTRIDLADSSEKLWRKLVNDGHHKLKDIGHVEWN